jgi:hypothetical protein
LLLFGDNLRKSNCIFTLVKRVEVSACEISGIRHSSPELMHAVLQLCPSPPIFHSRTPAAVHASSVDVAMLKPLSPEATMYVKEPSWYLPALQMVQTSAFAPEYVPAGQMAQTDAFAPEYAPAAQFKHALVPSLEYVPAAQARQALAEDAPEVAEYVPIPHRRHALPPVVSEYVPAAQSVQLLLPSDAEYLPLAQSRQILTPSADAYLPLAHSTQSVAASWPSVSRYLPAAQLVHVDAP